MSKQTKIGAEGSRLRMDASSKSGVELGTSAKKSHDRPSYGKDRREGETQKQVNPRSLQTEEHGARKG